MERLQSVTDWKREEVRFRLETGLHDVCTYICGHGHGAILHVLGTKSQLFLLSVDSRSVSFARVLKSAADARIWPCLMSRSDGEWEPASFRRLGSTS